MIRQYQNQKIYKNFKIVGILSIIALFLSVVSIILFILCIYFVQSEASKNVKIYSQILFYILAVCTPLTPLITAVKSEKTSDKPIKETKWINDFANTLTAAIIPFVPIVLILNSAYCFGYLLIPNIFLYVSSGFLIGNCVLIKREWKDDPPEYLKEKLKIQEERQKINTANRNMQTYESQIKKCGAKFFIKYYRQIKRLPLRDITVTENYSEQERNERILAAKQIMDAGLSAFALKQIQEQYGEFLDKTEIDTAQSILEELKNE